MKQIAAKSFFAFRTAQEDRYYVFNTSSLAVYQVPELVFQIAGLWESHSPSGIIRQLSDRFPVQDVEKGLESVTKIGLFNGGPPPPLNHKKLPPPPLQQIYLQISHDCNLRCRYCYADGGHFGGAALQMSEETALKAVDFFLEQLPKETVGSINFDGGEPLLNWQVIESVVQHATSKAKEMQKRVQFKLGTNGTLLNAHNTQIIDRHRFSVGVSIDGDPGTHDACRVYEKGNGSYHVIRENLDTYKENLTHTTLQARATITPKNLDVFQVVQHLMEQGFTHIYFEPVSTAPQELTLTPEHYDVIFQQCRELATFYTQELLKGKSYYLNNFDMYIKRLHFKQFHRYKCEVARTGAAVTPKGEIYPCYKFSNVEEFKMAQLNDRSPIGLESLSRRQPFLENQVDNRPDCADCWARYLCGGGCAYLGYTNLDDIAKKDDRECRFILHMAQLAMEIYVTVKNQIPGYWNTYFTPGIHPQT